MTPEYIDNLFLLTLYLLLFVAGLGVCSFIIRVYQFWQERRMWRRYWGT